MSATCSVSLFFSDDSKQDASTTTADSNRLIELLKNQKILMSALSKMWENTDDCAEKYRCATALYLMPVLSQHQSIIFDWSISAPGNGKEVVGSINEIDKCYMYQLMTNVQLLGSKRFEKQILMHS